MRGIAIKVIDTGVWLDVPDITFKMTFLNPLFVDNWNRRDRSTPFKFPKTPTNNKVFDWRGEIGIPTANPVIDCHVYQDGIFIFKGIIRIYDVGEAYQGHILTNFGEWDHRTLDKTLKDYLYDSGTPFTVPDATIEANTYPDVPFAFPNFYAFNFVDYRDGTISTGQNFYKHQYLNMQAGGSNSKFVSPYLMYVIDHIFQAEGMQKPEGNFMTDTELQTLVMLSNAHRPEDLTGWEFDARKFLPDMKVSAFFDSLRAMFNIGVFFDKFDGVPQILKNADLIQGSTVKDWSYITPYKWVKKFDKQFGKLRIGYSKEYYDLWKENEFPPQYKGPTQELSFYLANFPALKSTWLIESENTYWTNSNGNGKEPVDYNCLQVNPSDYRQFSPVPDVASLPAVTYPTDAGRICLVENEGWYYRVIYGSITGGAVWVKFAYDNWPYNADEPEDEIAFDIESKIGIPVMDRIGGEIAPSDELFYTPCFKNIRAITDLYQPGISDNMAMLAFNRGMQQHGAGVGMQPMFSSSEYDYGFNAIGNYSLRLHGERGLIKTFWEPAFNYFENGQPYIFNVNLSLLEFSKYNMYEKLHIHGLDGFVKTMNVEFPMRKPVEIEFVA